MCRQMKWEPKIKYDEYRYHMKVKVSRVDTTRQVFGELSVLLVFDYSKLYFYYYCLVYLVVWMNPDRCLTPVE